MDPAGILLLKVHVPVDERSEICQGCTGVSVVFPGCKDSFVFKSLSIKKFRNSQAVDVSFVLVPAYRLSSA